MSFYTRVAPKLKIELFHDSIILEVEYPSIDPFDDDTIVNLTFSKGEVKKLSSYYSVKTKEELLVSIESHYHTYDSLKLFQDFFDKRGIYSTLSHSSPLIN